MHLSCDVKIRLIEELETAYRRILALGEQEVRAVVRGDVETLQVLEGQQAVARTRRDDVMIVLREHIAEHGC